MNDILRRLRTVTYMHFSPSTGDATANVVVCDEYVVIVVDNSEPKLPEFTVRLPEKEVPHDHVDEPEPELRLKPEFPRPPHTELYRLAPRQRPPQKPSSYG